ADELDLAIHIHMLETRMQALSGRRMYGKTLPEHLAELGFLGPRVSFEHGIWLADGDVALVRDHGVTIVHNPVSNLKLGSGVCPVPELLRERVEIALGTDGMSSNDGNDMFAAVKAAGLLHKLWEIDYEEWPGARGGPRDGAGGHRPPRRRLQRRAAAPRIRPRRLARGDAHAGRRRAEAPADVDLIVRNARVGDRIVDLAVEDGRFVRIGPDLE